MVLLTIYLSGVLVSAVSYGINLYYSPTKFELPVDLIIVGILSLLSWANLLFIGYLYFKGEI